MQYRSVIVGGTFDGLHKGHRALLTKAFTVGAYVTIGLTTNDYVKNYKYQITNSKQIPNIKKSIQSFLARKKRLDIWLERRGWKGRYVIIPLDDIYGPTCVPGNDFDAIIVSEETKKNAEVINQFRNEQGMPALSIITILMEQGEDTRPISSTRIRNKEINGNGKLIMPLSLRTQLSEPFGSIIDNDALAATYAIDQKRIMIGVGDKTVEQMMILGVTPRLAIIDFLSGRERFFWQKQLLDTLYDHRTITTLVSGPGYIDTACITYMITWRQTCSPSLLIVDGEEDLLVLPLLCYAPDGAVIYYGQPNVGVVRVVVNQKIRTEAQLLLEKFRSKLAE